ncbi:MAG: glycosyltransferase family 4 protein [Anaerolineae bacterium]|nr:glycosyltransferase family 4 protein [Anaerolineae bacterium]
MHVLILSLDTSLLTQTTGNARQRHESYASLLGGHLSVIVCNRRGPAPLEPLRAYRFQALPTNSRGYLTYLPDAARAALALHADEKIDVIASQDPFLTGLIGLRLRREMAAPLIVQVHSPTLDSREFARERPRNRILQWLARRVVRQADAVRVVSQAERAAAIRRGAPPERVCVIPVAPDVERFAAPAPPDALAAWAGRLGVAPETPLVLWVGRPVGFKNVPMLLRAFRLVHEAAPAAHLVIAGDLALSPDNLPTLAAELGIRDAVHFPGPVAHNELPALYQASAVYAHSSLYEGLGLVMVEAGAAGLPVVATATDGALEVVVNGETGYLTPPRDVGAFAEAIIGLLDDREAARRMGERARAHVLARFDSLRLMREWVAMWERVARKEPPCAS